MIRPKVFISSRLSLAKVRVELKQIFEVAGFDVDLYEQNLTPSSHSATYLKDIRDADFVIFVLEEGYGTPRLTTGRSGTHDEWEAAWELDIPRHVYLKRAKKHDRRQKAFIKSALYANEVSYYFFKSENEIASRAQSSIAQIAIEIAESPRFRRRSNKDLLWAEMAEEEYQEFLRLNTPVEQIRQIERSQSNSGWITDGWATLSDLNFDPHSDYPFYDSTLRGWLGDFLMALDKLAKFESHWTESGAGNHRDGPIVAFPGERIGVSLYKFPVLVGPERERTSQESIWKDRSRLLRKALAIWDLIRKRVNTRHDRFAKPL